MSFIQKHFIQYLLIGCLILMSTCCIAQTNDDESWDEEETSIPAQPIISSILFSGNSTYSANELLKEISFIPNTTYSRTLVLEGKYFISNYYVDRGYKWVQVSTDIFTGDTTGNLTLKYFINEGPVTHIGDINIKGNDKTKDKVIYRELLFSPGSLYRRKDIYTSQNRLISLNYFTDVRFTEDTTTSNNTTVNITIEVVERGTGLWSFGAGYSTEEGIRGYTRYRQSNLFGNGQQFSTGIKWAEIGETYQRSREFRTDFFDPSFLDSKLGLGLETYYRREDFDNYDINRLGFGAYLTQLFWDNQVRATLKYRLEQDYVFNVDNIIDPYMLSINKTTDWISMVSASLEKDTRNSLINPSKGGIYSLEWGLSSKAFGSDYNYSKILIDLRRYHEIKPKVVLALRARAGHIESFGDTQSVPIYERLYGGGADSVRGIKDRYLGPADMDGYPKGGNTSLIYNMELRFPVYKDFGGVAFYDGGGVWKDISDVDLTDLHHSVGMGLRYMTPIGPLRVDYGYEVSGGHDKRIHFSVGQTF